MTFGQSFLSFFGSKLASENYHLNLKQMQTSMRPKPASRAPAAEEKRKQPSAEPAQKTTHEAAPQPKPQSSTTEKFKYYC